MNGESHVLEYHLEDENTHSFSLDTNIENVRDTFLPRSVDFIRVSEDKNEFY